MAKAKPPVSMADRIAAAGCLKHDQRVLVPCAGDGSLILAAARVAAVKIDLYERDEAVLDRLVGIGRKAAESGGGLSPIGRDFLAVDAAPIYDAVLLETEGLGAAVHAVSFVKPGGTLAALLPSYWRTLNTATADALRVLVLAVAKTIDIEVISANTDLMTMRRAG